MILATIDAADTIGNNASAFEHTVNEIVGNKLVSFAW